MPRKVGLILLSALLFSIFVLGSHPASANLFAPPVDKVVHMGVFALIAASLRAIWPNLYWPFVLLITAGIGLADELHQLLVPGRQAGWDDGVADIIGAAIGLIAMHLNPWKPR